VENTVSLKVLFREQTTTNMLPICSMEYEIQHDGDKSDTDHNQ